MNKKILIVYYSKTGNTERLAKNIALKLGADIEKIIDKKNRSGIIGWLNSGRGGMKKELTEIEKTTKNPADYDLIVIGTPVWSWNITPATRTYLNQNKEYLKKFAFFITSGDTEAEKIVPNVEEIIGQKAIVYFGLNEQELKNEEVYNKKITVFIETIKAKTGI